MARLFGALFFCVVSVAAVAQIPKALIGPDGQYSNGTAWRPQFHGIRVNGAADIEIVVGLRAGLYEDGERIRAKVERGVLLLDSVGDYRIVVRSLDLIEVNGAADISFLSIDCDSLRIDVNGACDATLSGRVRTLVVDVKGAADLMAVGLRVHTARVSIQGAADADLWVTGRLYVDIKGAGDVTYRGNPWKVVTNIEGPGEVSRREVK